MERVDEEVSIAHDAFVAKTASEAMRRSEEAAAAAAVKGLDAPGASDMSAPETREQTHCVPRSTVYERFAGEEASRPLHPANVQHGSDTTGPSPGLRGPGGELSFDDGFESGNLVRAERLEPWRASAPVRSAAARVATEAAASGLRLAVVDQEYALQMRADVNTSGNRQWFFFAVRGAVRGETVRFRVENHTKPDSLFAYGLRPLVLSERLLRSGDAAGAAAAGVGAGVAERADDGPRAACHPSDPCPAPGTGWHRAGTDCCYFRSRGEYWRPRGRARRSCFYEAAFTYTFPFDDDVVWFAYCRPYTYSRLQRLLGELETGPRTSRVVRRRLLCRTLAGNRCDVVTVTAPIASPTDLLRRKGAFISARVHPGETNASWMMEGVLRFVTSDAPAAAVLRRHCVIRIVPMVNPDGVILGNYRCSLAGQDLNR